MIRLPSGCQAGCLLAQKVACFLCAKWHREMRQLSMKTCVRSGDAGLPALATCRPRGNPVLPEGCREGCQ